MAQRRRFPTLPPMPGAPKSPRLLSLLCAAALGCSPTFEYGGEVDAELSADAGVVDEAPPVPNLLPRAWLGVHATRYEGDLQLVLTASTTSCGDAAGVAHGASPDRSFIQVGLSDTGSEAFEGVGQLCAEGVCRSLPATVQIWHHLEGEPATGSYRLSEDGEAVAEGEFTTAACAFDELGATDDP